MAATIFGIIATGARGIDNDIRTGAWTIVVAIMVIIGAARYDLAPVSAGKGCHPVSRAVYSGLAVAWRIVGCHAGTESYA